jgi:hypothetical protein
MQTRLVAVVLMFASAVVIAEPPRRNSSVPRPAPKVTAPGAASPAPLKLGVGDVRKYMMPSEYQASIDAPDLERSTIVVQGERAPPPPLKSTQPVPQGIIAPFWAVANPTQAWRVLLPDPNAPPPGPPDVVPKPEFRWGP